MTAYPNRSTFFAVLSVFFIVLADRLVQCQVVPITVSPTTTISSTASSATTSTSVSIPSTAANGGITITEPAQTADASYYKIAQGVTVTFGWNFTSVLSYPTSLVVQAVCSDNSNTYTIATSLPGTATNVTWVPYDYDQNAAQSGNPALIQATYRLEIFDERGLSVAASPGRFSPNTQVDFALYIPQPYTPIASGWFCSACSGASSLEVPRPLLLAVVSTCLVMVFGSWSILQR
ncbi:hypothetical protein CBS101457_000379 [Exobasidium rhododendri]|nr:hypothetical protein CBS101457_000379 [Exobasidium rhododendri]